MMTRMVEKAGIIKTRIMKNTRMVKEVNLFSGADHNSKFFRKKRK